MNSLLLCWVLSLSSTSVSSFWITSPLRWRWDFLLLLPQFFLLYLSWKFAHHQAGSSFYVFLSEPWRLVVFRSCLASPLFKSTGAWSHYFFHLASIILLSSSFCCVPTKMFFTFRNTTYSVSGGAYMVILSIYLWVRSQMFFTTCKACVLIFCE